MRQSNEHFQCKSLENIELIENENEEPMTTDCVPACMGVWWREPDAN